ncbi:formylglycine-generating enzyme family protein [Pirellulaceae bacterium SH501]
MSFLQFKLVRSLLCVATIFVLMPFAAAIRGDDPVLRIADDCVLPLVRIEPGKFDMGRSSRGAFAAAALSFGEQGDLATEGPVRNVTISRAFLIGKHKITAEQYCRFLNSTDGPERCVSINRFSNIENRDGMYHPKDGRRTFPINVVHWDGAKNFCDWLSKQSGRTVRLPTEAEWEYAARGSEGRATPWGNKAVMDWSSIEGSSVDAFSDNATPEGVVGLVDYVVGEWCSDFYGSRYILGDSQDPNGPTLDQLPVKTDLWWLATVEGKYHVLRGRVKRSNWSTTSRNLGDRADNAGIYGFRIVVDTDATENKP